MQFEVHKKQLCAHDISKKQTKLKYWPADCRSFQYYVRYNSTAAATEEVSYGRDLAPMRQMATSSSSQIEIKLQHNNFVIKFCRLTRVLIAVFMHPQIDILFRGIIINTENWQIIFSDNVVQLIYNRQTVGYKYWIKKQGNKSKTWVQVSFDVYCIARGQSRIIGADVISLMLSL